MAIASNNQTAKPSTPASGEKDYELFFFSEVVKRPVCAGKVSQRIGRLADLVFRFTDVYPEAVGIYVDHGWGKPTEFIPWDKVVKIEEDAIFVLPREDGGPYPPFVDQPGWLMVDAHLMGRTILDTDGRRTEVVNDVHLLASKGRMLIVHVDISFNGFLRKWGLFRFLHFKDKLISWRYVQPLSLEDVGNRDILELSVTRKHMLDLPVEDLADALETLSGEEQQAVFSALDSEKAAEVLMEAEPRAQRQLIATLRREKARQILSEMSIPQLADLFSALPHEHVVSMMSLLPEQDAGRIQAIISDRESVARVLMSTEFLAVPKDTKVGQVLAEIRSGRHPHDSISYVYVVAADAVLVGVVDLRDLVLAPDDAAVGDLMVFPVVMAQEDDVREDVAEMFAKYHFRMIPVVNKEDRLLGVIHYKDVMKGLVTRART